LGDNRVVIVVNGGFEEAFEDDGRSDKGGAARGKGSSVLLKLEMGLFVVGVDMGLEIWGDGGGHTLWQEKEEAWWGWVVTLELNKYKIKRKRKIVSRN
jgi:hypothetical protein